MRTAGEGRGAGDGLWCRRRRRSSNSPAAVRTKGGKEQNREGEMSFEKAPFQKGGEKRRGGWMEKSAAADATSTSFPPPVSVFQPLLCCASHPTPPPLSLLSTPDCARLAGAEKRGRQTEKRGGRRGKVDVGKSPSSSSATQPPSYVYPFYPFSLSPPRAFAQIAPRYKREKRLSLH